MHVQVFSPEGSFLRKWGSFGNGDGEFNCPNGIAFDSLDNVYVADACHHRIQLLSV